MKIKTLALVSVLFLAVVIVGTAGWYSHIKKNNIECDGRVVWEINNEQFSGNVTWQMHDSAGIATLTGVLHMSDSMRYKISRIAWFTYQNVRDNYIIHTQKLVRFPTDDLGQSAGIRAIPPIYLAEGTSFSLAIKAWQEGWAFTTIGAPSLFCSNSE